MTHYRVARLREIIRELADSANGNESLAMEAFRILNSLDGPEFITCVYCELPESPDNPLLTDASTDRLAHYDCIKNAGSESY